MLRFRDSVIQWLNDEERLLYYILVDARSGFPRLNPLLPPCLCLNTYVNTNLPSEQCYHHQHVTSQTNLLYSRRTFLPRCWDILWRCWLHNVYIFKIAYCKFWVHKKANYSKIVDIWPLRSFGCQHMPVTLYKKIIGNWFWYSSIRINTAGFH